MRRLKVINHMSLDGVIQNSPEDGFPYTDWGAPYRSPEGRDFMLEGTASATTRCSGVAPIVVCAYTLGEPLQLTSIGSTTSDG